MKSGIWVNKQYHNVDVSQRISLGEGNTPISSINFYKIDQPVILKFEDKNPNESFKDRSLAYQLSVHTASGRSKYVISSSGNAAISAAAYSKLLGVELDIFVASKVNKDKLKKIRQYESDKIKIHQGSRPKSEAMKFAVKNNAFNLRGSKDPEAVIGFKSIAYELAEQAPNTDAIFIPCSSGTSTVGIYEGFKEMNMNVAIHVCQTARINPIAKEFDKNFNPSSASLADAISDRVAHRKKQVVELIKETNGYGWVIDDSEILKARDALPLTGMDISANSLLSVAGMLKAREHNIEYIKPTLLISGK